MQKPICLVYWSVSPEEVRDNYQKVQSGLGKKFNDYHVLVVPSKRKEIIEIQLINSKNINRITLNQLKEQVAKEIASYNVEVAKDQKQEEDKK